MAGKKGSKRDTKVELWKLYDKQMGRIEKHEELEMKMKVPSSQTQDAMRFVFDILRALQVK